MTSPFTPEQESYLTQFADDLLQAFKKHTQEEYQRISKHAATLNENFETHTNRVVEENKDYSTRVIKELKASEARIEEGNTARHKEQIQQMRIASVAIVLGNNGASVDWAIGMVQKIEKQLKDEA